MFAESSAVQSVCVICSKCVKTCTNTMAVLQAQLALSGNTKKIYRANPRNKKLIQCMMHSQNRHSRSLTFDLFTFSNSPRPPLAGLYTTCIYKQYKGLTAVCKRRPPVCLIDRFYRFIDYYCWDYLAFQALVSPDDLNVDQFFSHPNKALIVEETLQYLSFSWHENIKFQINFYKYWNQSKTWANTLTSLLSVWLWTNSKELPQRSSVWSLTSCPILKLWTHEHGSTCTRPRRDHEMKIWVPKYLK